MRLRDYVRAHRPQIDVVIRSYRPKGFGTSSRINDAERESWVRNDEGLYQLAKQAGVKAP